jgi:hypothetical protein
VLQDVRFGKADGMDGMMKGGWPVDGRFSWSGEVERVRG